MVSKIGRRIYSTQHQAGRTQGRAASYSLTFQYTFQKSVRIKKPRILVEIIDQYTEMNNIAYGIVAYSFVSRYSCLEFNCVFLKYMIHGYMILCYIA